MESIRNIIGLVLFSLSLIFFTSPFLFANNIQVSNVRLTNQNTTDDFTMVEFDISWENSWRYAGGPGNWDAAWIFVKYRIASGPWIHAWLNNTGHQSCASTTIENGLLTPGNAFNSITNPALGVFLYRAVPGNGNFSCQDIQLRWNYGANGVADNAEVDVQVFAIEHVYIPQGSFVVGSGGTDYNGFYTYPANVPYLIQSEAAIPVGEINGNLYYNNNVNNGGDQLGPIPAEYPKGFKAFYAMKYEISQQGYIDFLNSLTREQQTSRVRTNISTFNILNEFVMTNTTNPVSRNGISCRSTIPTPPATAEFFSDINANTIEGEAADGQHIPCNFLQYADLAAYLDWAGLRLMTEFEFEKCGRGPLPAFPNEYAWGNRNIYYHVATNNTNTASEAPVENYSNTAGTNASGPLRTGCFARSNSNRTTAGAGYYGCLDLTGNLHERGVTVGNPQGRSYTGTHGNGMLTANGQADVVSWPIVTTGVGAFIRGGYHSSPYETKRLSDRADAAVSTNGADHAYGGRGVRTAQ